MFLLQLIVLFLLYPPNFPLPRKNEKRETKNKEKQKHIKILPLELIFNYKG